MIRLSWRQLRLPLIATAGLLALVVAVLVMMRGSLLSALHTTGLAECLAAGGDCDRPREEFHDIYAGLLRDLALLGFTPALIGVFWGAPLVAREVEQGTHRLVWTQSIPPQRWFVVRTGVFAAAAAVVAAVLTVGVAWWHRPFAGLGLDQFSVMNPPLYNLQGVNLAASTLFAFAVGVATGTVIRRTVPAMAVALPAFLLPHFILRGARPYLLPSESVTFPVGADSPRAGRGDWVTDTQFLDRSGRVMGHDELVSTCFNAGAGKGTLPCLAERGVQYHLAYHPMTQFWGLQGLEAAILIAGAVLLLAGAAWWTTRRVV